MQVVIELLKLLLLAMIFDTFIYPHLDIPSRYYKPVIATEILRFIFYVLLFDMCIDPYFNLTKFLGLLLVSKYNNEDSIFPTFPDHIIIPMLIKSRLIHYAIYGCTLIANHIVNK